MYVGFGHPFGGDRLIGSAWLSCSAKVEVPLVMKSSRGSDDFRSKGTKVCVLTNVPLTLTSQDLFHICRSVMLLLVNVWSNDAPASMSVTAGLHNNSSLTSVVDQNINLVILLTDYFECFGDGVVAFNIDLNGLDCAFGV